MYVLPNYSESLNLAHVSYSSSRPWCVRGFNFSRNHKIHVSYIWTKVIESHVAYRNIVYVIVIVWFYTRLQMKYDTWIQIYQLRIRITSKYTHSTPNCSCGVLQIERKQRKSIILFWRRVLDNNDWWRLYIYFIYMYVIIISNYCYKATTVILIY